MEVWVDIKGWEGCYQVSDLGNVRSVERQAETRGLSNSGFYLVNSRVLKQDIAKGYNRVTLSRFGKTKRFQVHRLVAHAFVYNPHNYKFVNHKKGNKQDNRASELEWVTSSMNEIHSYQVLMKVSSQAKLVLDIDTGIYYDSILKAANSKGINQSTLRSYVRRGIIYKGFCLV